MQTEGIPASCQVREDQCQPRHGTIQATQADIRVRREDVHPH